MHTSQVAPYKTLYKYILKHMINSQQMVVH